MKHIYLSIFFLVFMSRAVLAQAPNIKYQTPQVYTVNATITPLAPTNSGGSVPATIYGQVSTFAGTVTAGNVNGIGTAASFNAPTRTDLDANGNLFVVDRDNRLIRMITPSGVVSTFAGSGAQGFNDGTLLTTSFNQPNGIAFDPSGNIFITDAANDAIRKISSGLVTTIAGNGLQGAANGIGAAATFYNPYGDATDAVGNIFVADTKNNLIRKVTPTGVVTTFAGSGAAARVDGTGTAASFNSPNSLKIDASGNLYVSDSQNFVIRKITPSGVVTIFAGSGIQGSTNGGALIATFNSIGGVAIDNITGNIYVADLGNSLIRKIDVTGNVTTVAGTGLQGAVNGVGNAASFNRPNDITFTPGILYVTDYGNNMIRKIILTGYAIDKPLPAGLTFDATTGTISGTPVFTSQSTNYTVTAYNIYGSSSTIVNVTVNAAPALAPPNISYKTPQVYVVNTIISPLAPTNTGGAVPAATYALVTTIAGNGSNGTNAGATNGTGKAATFNNPSSTVIDAAGNIYVADQGSNMIRKITPAGVVTTFAGNGVAGHTNGTGTAATFSAPGGLAIDVVGNIYVADTYNSLIREITPAGVVTTYAGSGAVGATDGTTTTASFNRPIDLAIDPSGNLYVTDQFYHSIRKITQAGVVSTFAGQSGLFGSINGAGSAANFYYPKGLTTDAAGNVYVADTYNNLIRKITPAGIVTTLAGNNTAGSANGAGSAASFNTPTGVAVDGAGNLYVSDNKNNLVRMVTSAGTVTTLAGNGSQNSVDGNGTFAGFYLPTSISIDGVGSLYVTESNVIRKISIGGYVIDKALPAGLVFDTNTGIISGTPTVTSPATNYTVTAYNAGGSGSAVVNITIIAGISFPAISAKTICAADFDPGATISDGTVVYTSSNAAVATIVNGKIHIVGAGSSIITATVGTTIAQQTLTVTAPVAPIVKIIPDIPVPCQGIPINFTAFVTNGGTNPAYQWQLNGNNVGTNSATFSINSLVSSDIVQCVVTNNDSCPVSVTSNSTTGLFYAVPVTPSIAIQSDATGTVCAGTTITFTSTTTNGGIAPTYQWQVNGQNAGINSPVFAVNNLNNADVITCLLSNPGDKCVAPITVTSNAIKINVATPVTPFIVIQSNQSGPVCPGTLVGFTATVTNGGSNPTYQWQVNGKNAGANNPAFTTSNINNGDVITCILTNNDSKCITNPAATSNAITINLTAIIIPVISISASTNVIYPGTAVTFTASVNNLANISIYQWQVNGANAGTNSATFITSALNNGDIVTCIVTINSGCVSSFTSPDFAVTVLSLPHIIIPNTFTPNGDGINDTWEIKNLNQYPDCTVKIFNRSGQMVFSSIGYTSAWDGSYHNNVLPVGAYYYIINTNHALGTLSGAVNLIR